ncbi:MAG: 50S ribosomal protein L13 [Candidatus Nealsonbacteria bacterium]|nr:50S ribosomal protein L13 [Candidatus Nealsonbacteria bacterium]
MERKTYTIDAAGKVLGRLAVEISLLLRGKNKPNFVHYMDMGDFVIIKNAAKIVVSGKKMEQKKYYHHTSYPRGFREIPMKRIFEKNPGQVLRKAVLGMLPKNKLRAQQIKRLKFE